MISFFKKNFFIKFLDISDNELKIDTLLDLVRNVIVNYSILDFELHIRNVGLDPENSATPFHFFVCQSFFELILHLLFV